KWGNRLPRSIFPLQTIFHFATSMRNLFLLSARNLSNLQKPKRTMFDSSNIIVGLEIGTSKVCAAVGELNAAGVLNIIGLGQSRSRGVRKGEIADTNAADEDVRNAIVDAEKMAN